MANSITINSSAAARSLAAEKGYNVVFAKVVITNSRDYRGSACNTAWFVLNPNDMGDSVTISWDVTPHSATYNDQQSADGDKIDVGHEIVDLQAGCPYQVDENGTMNIDYAKSLDESDRPAYLFSNYSYAGTYGNGYYPVLLTQDPAGNKVPFWAADYGMDGSENCMMEACPNCMSGNIT
jgi:hypothetical protein